MAKHIKLTPNKTYKTVENAIKAVEKKYPESDDDGLTYITHQSDDGRFFPVFIGMRAVQAMVHFNFHVAA